MHITQNIHTICFSARHQRSWQNGFVWANTYISGYV